MGRDWTSQIVPSATAHSMSCGDAVVFLHLGGQVGEGAGLVVGEYAAGGLGAGQGDVLVLVAGAADDLVGLGAHPGADHRAVLFGQDVGVRLDRAADHDLAEPERGLDDDPGSVPCGRIGNEHDAGPLGVDHLLHHDRDGWFLGQAAFGPIGQRPLPEQRRPAVHEPYQQLRGDRTRW